MRRIRKEKHESRSRNGHWKRDVLTAISAIVARYRFGMKVERRKSDHPYIVFTDRGRAFGMIGLARAVYVDFEGNYDSEFENEVTIAAENNPPPRRIRMKA